MSKLRFLFSRKVSWHSMAAPAEMNDVISVTHRLAMRLADSSIISRAIETAKWQTRYPNSIYWLPHSIAQGDAGLALMFGHLDLCFPTEGWDRHAHDALQRACKAVKNCSAGIYAGLSGLAYTALYLSKNGVRYKKLISDADSFLLPLINENCNQFLSEEGYTSVDVWDIISGLSGTARYLIVRKNTPGFRQVLDKVLQCLVALTEDVNGLPRWFTPPELSPGENMKKMYPQGSLNCGMAHGIPGPLAALSLAKFNSVEIDGQETSIRKIADWLLTNRLNDKYGINWPAAIAVRNVGTKDTPAYIQTVESLYPSHTGWCYGPSGVALALWVAGKTLNDKCYKDKAIEVMRAVFARPVSERKLSNPGLCHGFAGQMQIAMRFAHNTGLQEFADEARTLAHLLLDKYYDPNTLLGFQAQESSGNKIDQAGLLDGTPGIILALLAAATDVEPKWDNIFMLS